jgi:hypothetical protein
MRNALYHSLKTRISQLRDQNLPATEVEAKLNSIVAFFDQDKQYFGRLAFASGYMRRTKTDGRLDWALIDPISEDRVGGNALPSEQDWWQDNCPPHLMPLVVQGSLKSKPEDKSMHTVTREDLLYKNGARTGCTVGTFDRIKHDVVITEEKYMPNRSMKGLKSTEYLVIGIEERVFS